MASTGAYVAVAVGCSVFGFAAGVTGDLLRQKLLINGKVAAARLRQGQDEVPDIEGNLQASFLEQPATEEEIRARSGSSRFSITAAEPEAASKENPEGSIASTTDSAENGAHRIADVLPYGAGEDDETSHSASLADVLPYGAAEDEESFVPDLSKCLPGCLDPVKGLHHAKCPNHASSLASRPVAPSSVSMAERIRQTGAVPYCHGLERMALPYMDSVTLDTA